MTSYQPPENIGDFGYDFNYAVWTPGTTVVLSRVKWDSTYRDIVWFDDYDKAWNYHDEKGIKLVVNGLTYCAQGQPVRLDIPFSKANEYNYMCVRNAADSVNSRNTFYYFITSVEYVAPHTTEFTVQLDVWQTYMHEIKFGMCYVERGHIGIAAQDKWENYGRKYLTVPEGLDTGGEYVISEVWRHDMASVEHIDGNVDSANYDIIVTSAIDLLVDYGTEDDPHFQTAKGSLAGGMANATCVYAMDVGNFRTLAEALSNCPWVSQGVQTITAIPKGIINFDGLSSAKTPDTSGYEEDKKRRTKKQGATVYPITTGFGSSGINNNQTIDLAPGFRKEDNIPERYRILWKLYTYPYMVYEVTMFNGAPLLVRPECVWDTSLKVTMWAHVVPPGPRIMFTVNGYNQNNTGDGNNAYSEHFDAMTGISALPTFALTNNGYLQYMAGNAHSIHYQYQSADWAQQKAIRGADTSYTQAQASMMQANQATDLTNAYSRQGAEYNANMRLLGGSLNTGASAIGQLAGGNIGGALSSALMGGINNGMAYGMAMENNRREIEARSAMTGLNNSYAKFNADTNLAMAKFAANGDYANAIAGINAKVQDSRMIAPTTSGGVGGDAFNLATYGWRLVCRQRRIDDGTLTRIGEFWLRYGYAMNVPTKVPKNLQCMTNFTYWKMQETYLYSTTCPEGFRQSIRGIFEKGVTVWSDPDRIGKTDFADNEPLPDVNINMEW
nr:MAG TPA: Major tail protein [Caudoviricetes sp.]